MEKERGIIITNVDESKKQIETLAFELFQRKTGLRFKSSLTAEQKKSITDVPEYEYYREEATKIYEKKQLAKSNKKYPVIDVPASGKSGWMGGAYTLCFVYSKHSGNFILSGYIKEVEAYLKKNYTHYFCNFSLWSHGFNRDIWRFWKENVGIFGPCKRSKEWKHIVRPYSSLTMDENEMKEKTFSFKRLPKRWIPEFDVL